MSASVIVTTKGGSASAVNSATVTSGTGSLTGDLMVVPLILRGATNGQDVTIPSGWAQILNPSTSGQRSQFPTGSGSGTNGCTFLYWKVATADGVQSYSFTWATTAAVNSWECHTVRGQTSGTPVELLGSLSATTATSLTTSGITTTEASELILRHVFGTLASGATTMTGSGLVWDAATSKIADIQGAGTSGAVWGSASQEIGPGTAGAVAGRSITLPNAPIASGTVTIGVKSSAVIAPTNSAAPVITTDGTPETGEAVGTDGGTWANTPTSYAYLWKRNGSTSGMTSNTSSSYTLVSGDVGQSITVTVTATNSAGSASATSAAITPSAPAPVSPPVNTVAPAITGTLAAGTTATCSPGTWTNSPTGYTYQWLRNGVAISGATASTYSLTALDVGTAKVSCSVSATNAGGSVTANAPSVDVAAATGTFAVTRYRVT